MTSYLISYMFCVDHGVDVSCGVVEATKCNYTSNNGDSTNGTQYYK